MEWFCRMGGLYVGGFTRNEGSLRVWYDGGRLMNHSIAGLKAV